ncbi:MAG TPA: hypothetical protein VG407_06110, partial [Caulobacteraceae bacterium]|nr:hypothetical protein [Caulobacteraceae bacterium]
MPTNTRDIPDNPYRQRDPWGARPAIPQVFTVTAAPAPVRRVFRPAPQTPASQAPTPHSLIPEAKPAPKTEFAKPQPAAPASDRLKLTAAPEPYDEPAPE